MTDTQRELVRGLRAVEIIRGISGSFVVNFLS